jgi:hypothetical protein
VLATGNLILVTVGGVGEGWMFGGEESTWVRKISSPVAEVFAMLADISAGVRRWRTEEHPEVSGLAASGALVTRCSCKGRICIVEWMGPGGGETSRVADSGFVTEAGLRGPCCGSG